MCIRDSNFAELADYYEMRPGPKWPCIADLLSLHPELLDRYDAFWFPDDDLAIQTPDINRMFALFHGFELSLAQPALTHDSYYSWRVLLQEPDNVLRMINFVEVMAPIFSRAALHTCLSSFTASPSGWGLDRIWPALCMANGLRQIGIIDAVAIKHTRPLGGDLYKNNPHLDCYRDEKDVLRKYSVSSYFRNPKYEILSERVTRVKDPLLSRFWLRLKKNLKKQPS